MSQVFVYEEPAETVNSAENGTLNLLKTLPEGGLVYSKDLHNIRKEFIQRVFTFYIVKNLVADDQMSGGNPENGQNDTSPMIDQSESQHQ